MDKNFLLGIGITNATKQDILQYILRSLKKTEDSYYITTPNPEILVYAGHHLQFKIILNQARLALPDGIGVMWAGKILGKPFRERITGVDFMELLCKEISGSNASTSEKPITVGFLGGRSKIAERAAECLQSRYPGLKVVFVSEEWPESYVVCAEVANENFRVAHAKKQKIKIRDFESANSHSENFVGSPRVLQTKFIDILFVAYGFPKQEEFMATHVGKIPVKVMIGVGGAFDYISGVVPRAPLLIRSIGFEWLFRLIVQPWRITRQLLLLKFTYLVLQEKLRNNTISE